MKAVWSVAFRAIVLVVFITAGFYFSYGQETERRVSIPRNAAWNDLVHQLGPGPENSSQESLIKECLLIQDFIEEHRSEATVGVYDVAVFRAIDQARARLQKADKDLEKIKNELSYKEDLRRETTEQQEK